MWIFVSIVLLLVSLTSRAAPAINVRGMCYGDSIYLGEGLTNIANAFPYVLTNRPWMRINGIPLANMTNVAISGAQIDTTLIPGIGTNITANASKPPTNNWVFADGWINWFFHGAISNTTSAALFWPTYTNYIFFLHTNAHYVVDSTITKWFAATAAQETARQTVNSWIKTNGAGWDFLMDNDAVLGTNAALFQDGLHPNDNGSILLWSNGDWVLVNVAPAHSTSYYVDNNNGNDANTGQAQSAPWKTLTNFNNGLFLATDSLLLTNGGNWTNQVIFRDGGVFAGGTNFPITLTSYGAAGPRPHISGGGATGGTIFGTNVDEWEIYYLDISSETGAAASYRAGIFWTNVTLAPCAHIWVTNCIVHDVNGDSSFSTGKASGGIVFYSSPAAIGYYFDVLLRGDVVTNVIREGIVLNMADDSPNGVLPQYGSNGVIQSCIIGLASGGVDAAYARGTSGLLYDHNIITNCADGLITGSSVNPVWQYNEGYNSGSSADGTLIDSDVFTYGGIAQYNYSHNNQGLSEALGNTSAGGGPIIRFNISQGDNAFFHWCALGVATNTQIYNNTAYISSGKTVIVIKGADSSGNTVNLTNNIIDNQGTASYDTITGLKSGFNDFFGNAVTGAPANPNGITSDPKLVNPGGGGIGIATATAYKLQAFSPAIRAGTPIANSGGKDFFSVSLQSGNPDIGAAQFGLYTQALFGNGTTMTLGNGTSMTLGQ